MKSRQRGFSLPEMMVVIAITVALGAGGGFGWQQWQQRQRLWQTAQQLGLFLGLLRQDANWMNRDHLLRLERDGEAWCITSGQVAGRGCGRENKWLYQPAFYEVQPEEITAGLGFYGTRNSAWPGHILLKSPAGRWKIIVSIWGRIRLCKMEGAGVCS